MFSQSENVTRNLKSLIDNVLSRTSMNNFPIEKLKIFKNVTNWSYNLDQSALIFTENFEELSTFNNHIELKNRFPKQLKFLVFIDEYFNDNAVNLDLKQKLNSDYGDISIYQYFMVRTNYWKIDLLTMEWHSINKCNNPIAIRENQFNLLTSKWNWNIDSKYEKFQNFYGCPLLFGFYYRYYEYAYEDRVDKEIKGSLVSFCKILGEKGNFIPNFKIHNRVKNSTQLDLDKNLKFNFDAFIDIKSVTVTSHHVTTTFSQIEMIFMITPSLKYTNFEKMALPFDSMTWIFLFLTFFIAFFVIFFVNRLSMKYQVIIYGEGVKMPAFNIVGTFFGIGQTRLPTSNFPRMILVFFVYFCLVIRTAYQGVSYNMLTNEMRRPEITQIKDLFENNYTIFTVDSKEYTTPLRKMVEYGTE